MANGRDDAERGTDEGAGHLGEYTDSPALI
jgi:hypothetical protein